MDNIEATPSHALWRDEESFPAGTAWESLLNDSIRTHLGQYDSIELIGFRVQRSGFRSAFGWVKLFADTCLSSSRAGANLTPDTILSMSFLQRSDWPLFGDGQRLY